MSKRATTIPTGLNPHDVGLPPSPAPVWLQRLLVGVFIAAVCGSMFYALTQHWRRGALMLGGSLVLLAALRVVVDSPRLGVLAVRSRRFDVAFSLIVGMSLSYLALSVDSLGS